MEQVVFAIVSNEQERSKEAVEAQLRTYISLGAPWLCWFIDDK